MSHLPSNDKDSEAILQGLPVEIRHARASDEVEIVRMLAESDLCYQDLTAAHLQSFWSAWSGPKLVGVVGLEAFGPHGLLRSLAVAEPFRGKGLGSELVRRMEDDAQSCGIGALYLLTLTAEEFFARRGYEYADRSAAPHALQGTTEFRSLCPASATCMVKHLDSN